MENTPRKEKFQIKNWDESSKKLQIQFPELTAADLKFVPGKEDDLLNRIENRISKKRSDVIDMINKYQSKLL